MKMDFSEFQKIRNAAKDREIAERQHDVSAARPPLQVGVTDMMIRDLYDRISKLESRVDSRALTQITPLAPRK